MAFVVVDTATVGETESRSTAKSRKVNAPHLVALVRAGATFVNGKLVERSEGEDAA